MRVNFFYSAPYDRMLTEMSGLSYSDNQSSEVKKFLIKVEKDWRKVEKKVIKEIENISKIKFNGDVTCFLVKNMDYNALSHPLTIKIYNDYDKFNDVLIHEIIHLLLVQNYESAKLLYLLERLYPNKDMSFIAHLPLFLIEKKVIENLFGARYYKNVLKEDNNIEGLKEVWEEANKINIRFINSKNGIIKFFENELAIR